jgi:hypothetical protein
LGKKSTAGVRNYTGEKLYTSEKIHDRGKNLNHRPFSLHRPFPTLVKFRHQAVSKEGEILDLIARRLHVYAGQKKGK